MREFLEELERTGNLLTISEPVSWDLEASAICGMAQRAGGPAVKFTNIKDYPGYTLVGGAFTGPHFIYHAEVPYRRMYSKIAIALGLEPLVKYEELMETIGERKKGPIRPLVVERGPCQEVIKKEKDVNLLELPIPKLHDKDGGRYLTGCVLAVRDEEIQWTNHGSYRLMVRDERSLVLGTIPRRTAPSHTQTIIEKYREKKKPLPFAIIIGGPPSLLFASALLYTPPMADDLSIAGGLSVTSIPTVKAQLSDILIPANSEIVLEGHIYPDEFANEGPFCSPSYYIEETKGPVLRVELISHRKNPILPFIAEGMMPSDTVCIYSVFHSQELMDIVRVTGVPVKYITLPTEARLCLAIVSISAKPWPGLPYKAAHTIWATSPFVRSVITIQPDLEPEEVARAITDTCQVAHPERGWHIGERDRPIGWTENHDWDSKVTSTLFIDATHRLDKEPETIPIRTKLEHVVPKETVKKILKKWKEWGLKPEAWSYEELQS